MERRTGVVQLVRMRQLAEAIDQNKDDWTGLTDPAARRKIQTRLHQRAWRKRKAQGARIEAGVDSVGPTEKGTFQVDETRPSQYLQTQRFASALRPNQLLDYQWDASASTGYQVESPPLISILYPDSSIPLEVASEIALDITPSIKHPLIPPILPYLNKATSSLPLPPIHFPIAPDHRLITLFQYNVLRATLTNMSLLSLLHRLPTYCASALQIPLLSPPPLPNSNFPHSLRPTLLQQTVTHDYWIDIMPIAQMRDNLILNQGLYDQDELCSDIVGGLYDGFDDVQNKGIIIWGEPWDADGWEISEGFARKWGFLLRGCGDAVRATNFWREGRGEERLVLEV